MLGNGVHNRPPGGSVLAHGPQVWPNGLYISLFFFFFEILNLIFKIKQQHWPSLHLVWVLWFLKSRVTGCSLLNAPSSRWAPGAGPPSGSSSSTAPPAPPSRRTRLPSASSRRCTGSGRPRPPAEQQLRRRWPRRRLLPESEDGDTDEFSRAETPPV